MSSTAESLLPVPPEGVRWTACSLTVLDPALTIERYEALLRQAGRMKSASSFWIGDLILFGDARYGERYAQAIEATGLREGTLANYASVCKHVAPSRRREDLSFGHHEAVTRLEPREQEEWLVKAEQNGWSRDELREAIRDAGRLTASAPAARSSRAQEVLGGTGIVDASRNLGEVHDVLVLTHEAIEGATVVGLAERIPGALRAIEETSALISAAARRMARPTLREQGERLVKQATRSSGFAMVPIEVFEAFVAALAEEG